MGAVPGVRRGCVAAFGSPDPNSGTERLVVLAETRETEKAEQNALRARIVEVTVAVLGEPPDEVVLAPPHTVLKTSSGKIRRAACRELYERRTGGCARHAGWWQVIRLICRFAAAASAACERRRWPSLLRPLRLADIRVDRAADVAADGAARRVPRRPGA